MVNQDRLEYYSYLENLRQSGVVNMFGAAPYLADAFNIDKNTAREILSDWMKNYDEIIEAIKTL